MDGMLSQEEISALLNGMNSESDTDNKQDDDTVTVGTKRKVEVVAPEIDESLLSADERDAIGEVANISMGSSATTLYSLVSRKVNITTPVVTLANWKTVVDDYEKPCVFIQIRYTLGLDGTNILVLKEHDVKVITDLMMGGDGTNTDGELGELHLSAISEAMNQMMGASATSLSTMLGKMIDISPPEATLVDLLEFSSGGDISSFLSGTFAKISFRMQIGDDLVDSTIMQLYPIDFAKSLYDIFINSNQEAAAAPAAPAPAAAPAPTPAAPAQPTPQPAAPAAAPQMAPQQMGMPMDMSAQANMGMPMMNMGQMGMPMMMGAVPQMQNMNIQPAQFQNFSNDFNPLQGQENMNLIMDVPLEVTVELGRTRKNISDILDFAPGTIIELDKIAGEPIDVLVNGKFVAKGEVVVIEESFGIRVTEIIK